MSSAATDRASAAWFWNSTVCPAVTVMWSGMNPASVIVTWNGGGIGRAAGGAAPTDAAEIAGSTPMATTSATAPAASLPICSRAAIICLLPVAPPELTTGSVLTSSVTNT